MNARAVFAVEPLLRHVLSHLDLPWEGAVAALTSFDFLVAERMESREHSVVELKSVGTQDRGRRWKLYPLADGGGISLGLMNSYAFYPHRQIDLGIVPGSAVTRNQIVIGIDFLVVDFGVSVQVRKSNMWTGFSVPGEAWSSYTTNTLRMTTGPEDFRPLLANEVIVLDAENFIPGDINSVAYAYKVRVRRRPQPGTVALARATGLF